MLFLANINLRWTELRENVQFLALRRCSKTLGSKFFDVSRQVYSRPVYISSNLPNCKTCQFMIFYDSFFGKLKVKLSVAFVFSSSLWLCPFVRYFIITR